MIRDLDETAVASATAEDIAFLVRNYSDWSYPQGATADDMAEAIKLIDMARKLKPAARAVVATYLASGELFCIECGEPSCIHGYPDH